MTTTKEKLNLMYELLSKIEDTSDPLLDDISWSREDEAIEAMRRILEGDKDDLANLRYQARLRRKENMVNMKNLRWQLRPTMAERSGHARTRHGIEMMLNREPFMVKLRAVMDTNKLFTVNDLPKRRMVM